MSLESMLITMLALAACSLTAAEKAGDPPVAPGASNGTREEALAHERLGLAAMQDSNANSSRIVDAAMEFSAALRILEPLQELDKCQEIKADIFWCKKRMNLDDLNAYLARKHDDGQAIGNYQRVVEVAEKKVAPEEGEAYFARARKFADENADKPFLVAIRYFEVAERFVGSDLAIKAQRLSLDAQEAHMRAGAGAQAARETLFSRPAQAVPGAQAPIPSPSEMKDAQAAVKKLFKDEPDGTRKQKESLARRCCEIAKSGKEDAKVNFALFSEALNQAQAAGNIYLIVTIVDEAAKQFRGYDPVAEKKAALAKIRTQEAAAAALRLLDDPADKDANAKAGRYICLMADAWDAGLPLLAAGADEKLAKMAGMELQKPSGALQEMEIGDLWYESGGKAAAPYKEGMWIRARYWYRMAMPGLEAVSKQKVDQRLDEIESLSPDPIADYDSLTAAQWERLKGRKFAVNCANQLNDPGITLKPGQKLRIVPNPTDTCTGMGLVINGSNTFTWKGAGGSTARFMGDETLPWMSLACWLDHGAKQAPGVIAGPGKVLLGIVNPYRIALTGTIRVKFVPLEE